MPLTAWDRRRGLTQGRIKPKGYTPPSGFYAFGIGNDLPGTLEPMAVGSAKDVSQNGSFGAAKVMRFSGKMRPPSSIPAGAGFEASMIVNGGKVMSQPFIPGWTRGLTDWAANVSGVVGSSMIAWQVEVTGNPGVIYNLELPALYVDAVAFDQAPLPVFLANRVPEPGEAGVPLDADIQLDIFDTVSSGVDMSTVMVYVRGTLAFSAGTFQTGFHGPSSGYSNPQDDVLRIIISPEAAKQFSSLEEIDVRVTGALPGGYILDTTYLFTALDATAPRLVSATALSQTVVRLSFDERVLQVDPAGPADSLNKANYSFSRLSPVAVSLSPQLVSPVNGTSVDITVQWPMTPGAVYQVTASAIQDLFENTIGTQFGSVSFLGFSPPVPKGRRFSLWEMIPIDVRNADTRGLLKLWTSVLQEPIDLIQYEIDRFLDLLSIDTCPDEWVDIYMQDAGTRSRGLIST